MKTPLIGISGSINNEETQQYVLRDYMRAVLDAGGIPVLLSLDMDAGATARCLERLDGLLMAGGNDISPALFGEEPIKELGEVNLPRDAFEMPLLRLAYDIDMPVLGICRGIQAMAVALGGFVYQDISVGRAGGEEALRIGHVQPPPYDKACHAVKTLSGTLLRECVGADELEVNSMHHQAAREPLPDCLTACAFAPDGVIEGVEAPSRTFFLGVQWHPERMTARDEASRRLFRAHVEACSRYADKRRAVK